MIVFDLACPTPGHVFEAWFASGDAFEEQLRRGLVQCPICGSAEVTKAAMAPRIASRPGCDDAKHLLAGLAEAQKRILAASENVGDRFSDEARAIHLGEADTRSIHGRATREDADRLRAEGVAVAPLPFPIVDPAAEN